MQDHISDAPTRSSSDNLRQVLQERDYEVSVTLKGKGLETLKRIDGFRCKIR